MTTNIYRIGFTQLGDDSAREGPYRVNIVFVHGLRGHPKKTWGKGLEDASEDEQGTGPSSRTTLRLLLRRNVSVSSSRATPGDVGSSRSVFWPEEYLVDDLPQARIWTYGYNAKVIDGLFGANNKNSVSQHGRDLAVRFSREIDNDDPVVFIGHSLGGIIVKDAMRRSEACRVRTKLVIFFGTPHRGSAYAAWGDIASNLAKLALQDPNTRLVKALEVNSEVLDNIQEEFKTIIHARNIKVHSFQESRGLSGMKGLDGKVVDDFSSKVDLPAALETVESIDADHKQMVKCISRADDRYRAVVGVLKQFMRSTLPDAMPPTYQLAVNLSPGQAQDDDALDASTRTRFFVPFSNNKRFVGRETIFHNLETKLFAQNLERVALFGLGGLGKTQIARQFAQWVKIHKTDYSVLWMPAFSLESFGQASVELSKQLGLRHSSTTDCKEVLRQYLCSEKAGNWLLVVDGADDLDILYGNQTQPKGIHAFLPQTENGRILFTTRSREVAVTAAGSDVVQLSQMSEEDASLLLQRLLIDKDQLRNEDVMAEFLETVECLPLAIAQAAAYLNIRNVPIAEYLRLLKRSKLDSIELLSIEIRDDAHHNRTQGAVASTWISSLHEISMRNSLAESVLAFIAWIEPKGIPGSILSDLGSRRDMLRATSLLSDYGFLSLREDRETFDVPNLVHLVLQTRAQKKGARRMRSQEVIAHLEKVFPSIKPENREQWRQYLPHTLRVLASGELENNKTICKLGKRVSSSLIYDGRFADAVEVCTAVVAAGLGTWRKDDPAELGAKYALERAYNSNGQSREAVEILQEVVRARDTSLPEDARDRLASRHALARAHVANGSPKEAVRLLENVVSIRGRLPADNIDLVASQHALGRAYESTGQIKEAIHILQNVVVAREASSNDHPDRLSSQHALARVYLADGRVDEAIALLEFVLARRVVTLTEGHYERLSTQYVLAKAYATRGRVEEAIKLLVFVAEKQKGLAEGHPHRVASDRLLKQLRDL